MCAALNDLNTILQGDMFNSSLCKSKQKYYFFWLLHSSWNSTNYKSHRRRCLKIENIYIQADPAHYFHYKCQSWEVKICYKVLHVLVKHWLGPGCIIVQHIKQTALRPSIFYSITCLSQLLTTPRFLQSSRSLSRSVRLRWMIRCRRLSRAKSYMYWANCLTESSRPMKRLSTM